MYRFIRGGLTLFSRVWSQGTVVSAEEAAEIGLDKWFEETGGETWAGKFVEKVDEKAKKSSRRSSRKSSKKSKPTIEEDGIEAVLAEKNLTLAKVRKMKWQELAKAFGPQLAKKVRDYGKSNDSK